MLVPILLWHQVGTKTLSACSSTPATSWLPLAESHLTRRLFADMLAKIAMLPRPARDKVSTKRSISMTTPEAQGEVSPKSIRKTASSAVWSPPDAKPVSPRSAGNHAEQNWIKPCRGKPFDLSKSLELKGQKGNSR